MSKDLDPMPKSDLPSSWTQALPNISETARVLARRRQQQLTKPPGSLGRLEQLAEQLAALLDTPHPNLNRVTISIFASDHGVCAEDVSAFPQAVTGQMMANFVSGGAAISVLAHTLGASLEIVNLGLAHPAPALPRVIDQTISPGTANLASEAAMSSEQFAAALQAGDDAAERARIAGAQLFIGGDMGIGNTTAATAVACALLEQPAEAMAGPGTGLEPQRVRHKAAVIRRALQRHGDDRSVERVLSSLGGYEIVALAGAMLGCAQRRIPVLVDGFIVSVAALAAVRQQPALAPWLIFAHRSAEPGHQQVLEALDAEPLLDLGMRLGEGSGAAVAVPLLRAACDLHNSMATFAEAGVSNGQ